MISLISTWPSWLQSPTQMGLAVGVTVGVDVHEGVTVAVPVFDGVEVTDGVGVMDGVRVAVLGVSEDTWISPGSHRAAVHDPSVAVAMTFVHSTGIRSGITWVAISIWQSKRTT